MQPLVFIADDDADVVDLLTRRCRNLGLRVDSAPNAMTALGKIEENEPDLVILDVDMPQGNGLSICEMMAGHESLANIPVIMLTASSSESTIRRCHQLCAYYVLKSPDVWSRVEPLLREVLALDRVTAQPPGSAELPPARTPLAGSEDEAAERQPSPGTLSNAWMDCVFAMLGVEEGESLFEHPTDARLQRSEQPWVLLIEDDDDVALTLKLRLQGFGVKVVRAAAGREGYRRAFLDAPRAIILDYELPHGNGDYVLTRLKETPATRNIPVIVLTGRHEGSIERQMRGLGASEFLTKPFNWKRLREALQVNLDDCEILTHAGPAPQNPA
jgi:CheY-like chemotaxis protein